MSPDGWSAAQTGYVLKMEFALTLSLPRDALTVPVSRHVCRSALAELGAAEDVVSDIEIALTEACTNVLKHSGPGDEYEVTVDVTPDACVIRVVDSGRGFDSKAVSQEPSDVAAERGRGIELMTALVDHVQFVSRDDDGTIVHLEKKMHFGDSAPITLLSR
jgi:serine/threonine-protein kinase RsbW